jgi:hypothetical protein
MRNKEELLKELAKIKEQEIKEEEEERKAKNYENFINRANDYMIGKAHCDLDFINKRYEDDRLESIFPISVSITGNSGATFTGKIPMTSASKTYYRNIWGDGKVDYEKAFDEELKNLVKKYVDLVCNDISCKLELMGLQNNDYYINANNFPEDKINEVKNILEESRAELLDKYSDDEIKSLIYEYPQYNEEGERVNSELRTRLSHSNMILYKYIFSKRPTLQDYFSNTSFYKSHKKDIVTI